MLCCSLAFSQEESDRGYAELSVIPRVDLNPMWNTGDKSFGFDLGNSSLYTLFEGSASEHFSWTIANHWLSAGSWIESGVDALEMFKALGYSDTVNWLDYCKADLSFGNWTFTLGKDCITTGGHEYEDWDWEVHPLLASPLWNQLSPYQWGAKVAYTTPSEMSTFSLQMTTSPFGARPFSSGLYTYSAQWSGAYGWFSPLWSVSAFGREASVFSSAPREYDFLVSLGNQVLLEDWTLTLDWSNTCGMSEDYDRFLGGHSFHGRVDYAPSDRFDVSLRGNYILTDKSVFNTNGFSLGSVLQFYPIPDSQDLRLHATVAYDSLLSNFAVSFGALYNLCFNLW
ncbi:MAG: hypothetical protein K6D54_00240 [Bacteroidales bacterium]|nr:hypothetical protein [Bacteroidales bacterium]